VIILDTNVVSEPMKPGREKRVLEWLDEQASETLYLTSVSFAELLVGVEILPDGKRKAGLHSGLTALIERLFGPRILPFDQAAAEQYARIVAEMRKAGLGISVAECQIASIALTHGFLVATRDVEPFRSAGVGVINPWE
jgi:predicted nucleic acid-binding protein